MTGPTTSATPEPGAPPTLPDAPPRTAPEARPAQRGRLVGSVALGLLVVLYGLLVMSLRPAALAGIVVLAAVALIVSGVVQFGLAAGMDRSWRWLGYLGGLVGIAAGVAAFVWPGLTLIVLALLIAWSFVINGVARIVGSLSDRERDLWWLGLLGGAVELLLGLWAIGSPGREVFLMVNLIGIFLVIAGVDLMVSALAERSKPRT